MKSYRNFSKKKCKNFGYTFSIFFLLLSCYDFYFVSYLFKFYFFPSLIFFLLTLFKPTFLSFFGYYWEKFGILLGRLFSPIILSFVYLITIIPINILIRIFNVDLLNKNYESKKSSYWFKVENKETNFEDQF
jgi:hypothetical protein